MTVDDFKNEILVEIENLSPMEQNQTMAKVLKHLQGQRAERHAKLIADAQALKIAMEDLDKMVRDSVKY